MTKTKNEVFLNLGQAFYEWYRSDKLKFVYGTEGKNLETEIERISELIEYVKDKKRSLGDNI